MDRWNAAYGPASRAKRAVAVIIQEQNSRCVRAPHDCNRCCGLAVLYLHLTCRHAVLLGQSRATGWPCAGCLARTASNEGCCVLATAMRDGVSDTDTRCLSSAPGGVRQLRR